MTTGPLVTVVTAAYNALADLRETVASVAGQAGWPVEHVIVDGGSNDGTREYLTTLPSTVRWISEPDRGIADAMNKGLALASGEFVLVLQAGDLFASSGSIAMAQPHLCTDRDMASFAVLLRNGNSDRRLRPHRLGLRTGFKMTSPHQGLFVRRQLYERIGGFDTGLRIASDYEFLLRARRSGARLAAIDEVLAIMPETGISTRPDWESVRRRLLEDRELQQRHASGALGRAINSLFWRAYLPFKMAKTKVGGA